MTIPTWALAQANMSVCINGTFIPFKNAPDAMHRFVRPALFSTADEVYELRFFGSAFLGRYRGASVAISAAHQTDVSVGAPPAEKFVVVVKSAGQNLAIPPTNLHIPVVENPDHQSLRDLIFFAFGHEPARTVHLDLTEVLWSDAEHVAVDYSFLIGYPTSSNIIELDPDDPTRLSNFTMRWIRQDLEAAGPQLLDTEHRNIFVKHKRSTRDSVDPDGLSGSPVFSIVRRGLRERFLRFDGIVTNANGDRFAVYPSVFIRDMLDHIVEQGQA